MKLANLRANQQKEEEEADRGPTQVRPGPAMRLEISAPFCREPSAYRSSFLSTPPPPADPPSGAAQADLEALMEPEERRRKSSLLHRFRQMLGTLTAARRKARQESIARGGPRVVEVNIGFGRIVILDIEAPSLSVSLV